MDKKKVVSTNRQAFRDYHVLETMEAGLQLTGTEVKSLRVAKCQLKDGFGRFEKNEVFIYGIHIAPYNEGNIYNHDPVRPRKLLLHKREILRLYGQLTQKGLTLIPIKIYLKHGIFKCEIALVKTKKAYDHRADIKKRIAKREIDRAIKSHPNKR